MILVRASYFLFPIHNANVLSASPPTHAPFQHHLETRDPWQVPRSHAADFYAGRDVQVPQGRRDPVHLGPFDDEPIEDEDATISHDGRAEEGRVWEDDACKSTVALLCDLVHLHQIFALFPAFPPQSTFQESRINSPCPPQGSEIYSDDPNVNEEVGSIQLDPSLIEDDKGNGIGSFLSPGVVTPNPSDVHSRLDEDKNSFEEWLGDELETPHGLSTLLSSSARSAPIPDDAEIIGIDDSDDEQENQMSEKHINRSGELNTSSNVEEQQNFQEMESDSEIIAPAVSVTESNPEPEHNESAHMEVEEIDAFNLGEYTN